MDEPRFDISFGEHGPSFDYHFEWHGETSCYGTNPNHGYTFDEVKEVMAEHHESMAAYWRELTLKQWQG